MLLWTIGLAALAMMLTACPKTWPNCDNDGDCREYDRGANYCVDGVCVGCRGASDCDRGQICRNNACERDPDWCDGDGECGDGMICEGNRCVGGCSADNPCPEGQLCQSGRCVRDPDWCGGDRDCPAGQVCQDNACVQGSPCYDRELEAVYFDFDESVVRADQEGNLNHNIACLDEYPDDNIQIEGHCDERGTDGYNLALGERRARATERWLTRTGGVDGDRLSKISYGETRPVCRASNESCWRQNRRSEFTWR